MPDELVKRLKKVSDGVYGGFGFSVLRGLEPAKYTPKQNVTLYAGIAANAGFQRGFVDRACEEVLGESVYIEADVYDSNKMVIAHIVNVQEADNNPGPVAPGFSNVPLVSRTAKLAIMQFQMLTGQCKSFHTDFCEIMAFYHLETALNGGHTILTSSWRTYNELAFTHPEVLHTLAEPWVLDT